MSATPGHEVAVTTQPQAPPGARRPGDLWGGFWPDDRVPARVPVLAGAAAAGLLAGLVLPFRDLGLGTFVVLLAAGAVVLASSRHQRAPFTLACAGLCVLLAATTVVRDAEWIVALCILGGGALCLSAVGGGRTLAGFVLSGLAWPLAALRGLPWLGRTLTALAGLGHGAALLRTLVWSLLGLVVFGALFASADALLAEWVGALLPDLDTVAVRVVVAVAVGGAVLAASYVGLNPPRVDLDPGARRPVARRYEWLAPVIVVNGVFAAFLAAQAAVVFGGHDHLRRSTGLTYAEYVHQGFGQLTVATVLTLTVVWAAARTAPRATPTDRAWLRASLGLLCLQTLAVVASALHRMHVYQEAYGFTRLRLLVDVVEGWLGLVVLAVLAGGALLRAPWLPRFALLTGAAALLGIAAINPDAWIAERNLDRYDDTGRVDWSYLAGLSDDAVPVLGQLSEDVRPCALGDREASSDDWLGWNWSRSRAADLLPTTATGPSPMTSPMTSSMTCPES